MSMHFFTIEGFSKQEVMANLRREYPNYLDARQIGDFKEKTIPRFFSLIRRKKYIASFVIIDKQKAVDSAVHTIQAKNKKFSEEKSRKSPFVSDMNQVKRAVDIIESGQSPSALVFRPGADRTEKPDPAEYAGLRDSSRTLPAEEEPEAGLPGRDLNAAPFSSPAPESPGLADPAEAAFIKRLRDHDTDEEVLDLIMREMKGSVTGSPFPEPGLVPQNLKSAIGRVLKFHPPFSLGEGEKKIVLFAGPTGVGKTTTLVKLSAESFRNQVPLRFMTNDTYRVGATSQLESYTKILNAPLDIVNNSDEFNKKMATARERLIFVDTAGRSPRDDNKQAELRQFLSGLDRRDYVLEAYLVLAMTTDRKDLDETVASFSFLNPVGVVLTKTDESHRYGKIINFLCRTGLPAVYFTTGQSVPEDIVPATPASLAEMILN
jgi:flagellar biosynthesis protein FlhF